MKKTFIYIFFVFLAGCGIKNNVKYDKPVTNDGASVTEFEYDNYNFAELEDVYDNLNYDDALSDYSKILGKDFRAIRFRYFIIFSNLDDKVTYQLIDSDIRNTVDVMLNNYIETRPDEVTPIFLFKDMQSYKDFSIKEFGVDETDLSPYGFYKISRNVILIRYVNWKGSTSHEATHAMLQNDFPNIPSWFNEGFAAMHEKAIFNNGRFIGNFNWRILALRRAFNDNNYTSLRHLMNTNDDEFYGTRTSFYYAQGCYLFMLLQEKGLFEEYYKSFRDNYSDDHTGIKQLEKITGESIEKLDAELVEYIQSFKQEFN
ncbi:MAG: hypothetical protein JST55_06355 [Bacteroidetes bacterium]|nr:hypothetical protein [Bacteroidota bacterium]